MNKQLNAILVILMISGSLISLAQEKLLTPEDAIYMNREIYPASVSQLQWIGQK